MRTCGEKAHIQSCGLLSILMTRLFWISSFFLCDLSSIRFSSKIFMRKYGSKRPIQTFRLFYIDLLDGEILWTYMHSSLWFKSGSFFVKEIPLWGNLGRNCLFEVSRSYMSRLMMRLFQILCFLLCDLSSILHSFLESFLQVVKSVRRSHHPNFFIIATPKDEKYRVICWQIRLITQLKGT